MRWLVLLAVAGCFGGPCHSNWYADIEPDPRHYGALAAGAHAAGIPLETEPMPRALPFENATLRGRWGDYALHSVAWTLEEGSATRAPLGASLYADGLFAVSRTEASPEEARAVARRFLANVSGAPPERHEAWIDALLASPNRETTIEPPYRLEETFAAAFAEGGAESGQFGQARLDAGGWSYFFVLPQRAASVPVGGESVHVSLDAEGRGGAYVRTDARAITPEEAARAANEALGRLGLAPRLAAAAMREDPCGV